MRDWFAPSFDITLKTAQARESLRRYAVEIAGRYNVATSVEVMVGDPPETLMQASERAELVVLGQRGHSRFKALLVGRTVDRMLRTCRRPVLVVRTPVDVSYRRVLVPIDFTSTSDTAAQVAARITRGAGLHVFHAIDPHREAVLRAADLPEHVIHESRLRQEAGTGARMRRRVARLGLDSTRMSFAVAHGPAVRSTLRQAQLLGADLIVAGKQGQSTLAGFLLGSVSSRVLSGARCDMLIVPRARSERPACAASAQRRLAGPASAPDTASLPRHAAALTGASAAGRQPGTAERFCSGRIG